MADCGSEDGPLWSVPLVALNVSCRKKLGLYLNPRAAVAADWTVVAEAMDFTYLEIKNYEACRNPTATVLEEWQARCSDASVGKLLSILAEVERNDIVEDLRPLIGATRGVIGSSTHAQRISSSSSLMTVHRGVPVQSFPDQEVVYATREL